MARDNGIKLPLWAKRDDMSDANIKVDAFLSEKLRCLNWIYFVLFKNGGLGVFFVNGFCIVNIFSRRVRDAQSYSV